MGENNKTNESKDIPKQSIKDEDKKNDNNISLYESLAIYKPLLPTVVVNYLESSLNDIKELKINDNLKTNQINKLTKELNDTNEKLNSY